MNIKKVFKAFEKAEQVSNMASDAWDANPDDTALEAAFDKAYADEFKAFAALVSEIVKVSHGLISEKIAGVMIRTKRGELRDLIGTYERQTNARPARLFQHFLPDFAFPLRKRGNVQPARERIPYCRF